MSNELLQVQAGTSPAFWFWVVCALLGLAAELATLTFALLLLSLGAAMAALCAYFLPDSLTWQILTFSLGAIAAVLVGKRRAQQRLKSSPDVIDVIGQPVTIETIDAQGRVQSVRWRDSSWPAQCDDATVFSVGASARIVSVSGNLITIRPA